MTVTYLIKTMRCGGEGDELKIHQKMSKPRPFLNVCVLYSQLALVPFDPLGGAEALAR